MENEERRRINLTETRVSMKLPIYLMGENSADRWEYDIAEDFDG